MLHAPLMEQIAGTLATAFVAGLWQGAVLILLAAALLRLMPRASARLRHALLLVSFITALLLPFMRGNAARGTAGDTSHALPIASWVAVSIALLWLAAAGARALQLLVAWNHLRTVRRDAAPIALEGAASFPAGNRRARLCTSAAVDSPTIIGFWSPALLLPEWMAPQLSSAELQQIALHECEHLRRHDDWLNLLLQLGLTLVPLNPGLLWLNRRISVQRELACDDAVVASTGQPIAYASCLARLAEQRLQRRSRLRLALAAWERSSELAQRLHALLQQPTRWTPRQSGAASVTAAALLMAASAGLARVPQFIRIVPAAVSSAASMAAVEIVPAPGVVPARSVQIPPLAMLPVTLHLRPGISLRKNFSRHTTLRHRPALRMTVSSHIAANPLKLPLLRTAAAGDASRRRITAAGFDEDAPVRLVPAEFFTPYVAVPTANGWLLIQL